MNPKKTGTDDVISAKILETCNDSCTWFSNHLCSNIVTTGNFVEKLKLADITPIFEKKDPFNKEKYRAVSVLSEVSKIFERINKDRWIVR